MPKAPNTAGLVQHIDCPVSYYTGVPEIKIPLYEIDVYGFKIPLTINYHASGIRASQEATWVGLGWNLNCGGMVSRTVRCSDDFHEYSDSYEDIVQGYYDGPEAYPPLQDDYFSSELLGNTKLLIDSEPDVFFYSIPSGGGKFLLDKSRGPVLLTRIGSSNVKIELEGTKNGVYGNYTFKITDVYGNVYYFRQKEITWTYSRAGELNGNRPGATVFDESRSTVEMRYEAPRKYTSSWLLTQIVTSKGKNINFTYSRESYQLPTQESVLKYNFLGGEGTIGSVGSNTRYSCSKTVIESYRLSGISWDNGSVSFTASSREDMNVWEDGCPRNSIK